MKEGAARSGRNPDEVNMAEYIRICVDDDVALARKALTRATISYASRGNTGGPPSGYRAHFERMGFKEKLEVVDAMKDKGAPEDEVFEAFPDDLLLQVGYYGKADGAAAAFKRISEGLDTAIVRVVAARPGDISSTRAVMEACQPSKVVGES